MVVTPRRRTASGRRGSAMDTRFCTSTWASSMLVPMPKVTVSCMRPSLVDCELMYSMPSTPFSSSSIGVATVRLTTSALAPG